MIDNRIIRFFRKHHVLTIATAVDNQPWCANCFYVYFEEDNSLVFTTGTDTRHGQEFLKNPLVAGSVVLETFVVGKIRGIQFQGIVSEPGEELLARVKTLYLRRFPVAVLMDTHLWHLKLNYIKMTDNRLGFGKKIVWEREV